MASLRRHDEFVGYSGPHSTSFVHCVPRSLPAVRRKRAYRHHVSGKLCAMPRSPGRPKGTSSNLAVIDDLFLDGAFTEKAGVAEVAAKCESIVLDSEGRDGMTVEEYALWRGARLRALIANAEAHRGEGGPDPLRPSKLKVRRLRERMKNLGKPVQVKRRKKKPKVAAQCSEPSASAGAECAPNTLT